MQIRFRSWCAASSPNTRRALPRCHIQWHQLKPNALKPIGCPWNAIYYVFSGNVSIKEDKFSNWFSNVIFLKFRILKPSQSERSPTLDAHNQKRTFSISDLVWDAGRLGFKIALNIIPDCTRKPKTKTHELGIETAVRRTNAANNGQLAGLWAGAAVVAAGGTEGIQWSSRTAQAFLTW